MANPEGKKPRGWGEFLDPNKIPKEVNFRLISTRLSQKTLWNRNVLKSDRNS